MSINFNLAKKFFYMRKFIILLFLSGSCTNDKLNTPIQVAENKSIIGSNFSNTLSNLSPVKKYAEDKKSAFIYNNTIKSIQPKMPRDSLKIVLEIIHYWDQVYRDSLYIKNTTIQISDKAKIKKYWKKITFYDKMNQKLMLYLFQTIGGWPDTKNLGNEASMAIWLVIHHNYDTIEFSKQIIPYLNQAYFSDSVITNTLYADLFDQVNYTVNGHDKYGTFAYYKDFYHDSVKTKINRERIKIGLNKI